MPTPFYCIYGSIKLISCDLVLVDDSNVIFGIARDILNGLEYLHGNGIVSRNVGLNTILINAEVLFV